MSLTEKRNNTEADDITFIYDEWGKTVVPDSALREILGHTDVGKHDEVYWHVDDGKVWIDVKPKDAE
jgi:hypothetical protein